MQKLTAIKLNLNELKDVLRINFPKVDEIGITSIIEGNQEEIVINVEQNKEEILIDKEDLKEILSETLNVAIDDVIVVPEEEEIVILSSNINGIRLI